MVQSQLGVKLIYLGKKKNNLVLRFTNGAVSHFLTGWKSLFIFTLLRHRQGLPSVVGPFDEPSSEVAALSNPDPAPYKEGPVSRRILHRTLLPVWKNVLVRVSDLRLIHRDAMLDSGCTVMFLKAAARQCFSFLPYCLKGSAVISQISTIKSYLSPNSSESVLQ